MMNSDAPDGSAHPCLISVKDTYILSTVFRELKIVNQLILEQFQGRKYEPSLTVRHPNGVVFQLFIGI